MNTSVTRYHPLLVSLHWVLAAFIIAALALGALKMARIPNTDPLKIGALRGHMSGGLLILGLMVLRLAVRAMSTHPAAATTGHARLDRLAWLSHRLFYVLVFGMLGSGLYVAIQSGAIRILAGVHGPLPPDFWAFPARRVHYVFSRLLIALIAVHSVAVAYHTFIVRDGLLRRMAFGRRAMPGTHRPSPQLQREE